MRRISVQRRIELCMSLLFAIGPTLSLSVAKEATGIPAQAPTLIEDLAETDADVAESGAPPQTDSPKSKAETAKRQESSSPPQGDTVPHPPTTEELETARQNAETDGDLEGGAIGASVENVGSAATTSVIAPEATGSPQAETTRQPPINLVPHSTNTTIEGARTVASADSPMETRRPYIGVVGGSKSAKIFKVRRRSAASLAGIRIGDVIKKVDQTPVAGFDEFLAEIERFQPGDAIDIEVVRGGKLVSLFVILGVRQ